MAKATQYEFETLCRAILDAVGGSQNIANVFHCITRLRIVPVNRDLVDMAKLSSIKGILKVVESSGQIQCVIGTTVPEVYNDFIAISGINPGGEVKADAADTASDAAAVQEKKQNLIIRGLNTLAACVTPYLYAIVAGGMIKGIVSLITALGLAASDSDIITVLSAVGDAPFYFMPFMAGYAAAKRFRVKEVFGLMTAGILMYSTFSAPAEGVSSYAFGFIDIPAYNYKSSLFPVILHTALGIPGILASILTQISLYSINLGIMGKANQAINVDQYELVASLRYVTAETDVKLAFFLRMILGAILLIALLYWFFGTELGASIRATGCNLQMASAQGINTNFCKVLALMLSNGLVGLCGGVYAQYQGSADVNMGRGAIVIGLAAVIISEVLFEKLCAGRKMAFAFTLGAVFIGAILYYVVIAFVLWLKMPSDYMKLFSAVVVACFLSVPYLRQKYSKKKKGAVKA